MNDTITTYGIRLSLFVAMFFILLNIFLTGLAQMHIQAYKIDSNSMTPTITKGALVLASKQQEYLRGDVIVFSGDADAFTTHRIIARDDHGRMRTQGDANSALDPSPVPSEAIKGKVLLSLPLLGSLFVFVKSTLGLFLVVVIPVAIYLTSIIVNKFATLKQHE